MSVHPTHMDADFECIEAGVNIVEQPMSIRGPSRIVAKNHKIDAVMTFLFKMKVF